MSDDKELENLQDEIQQALSDVLAKYENSAILKWVALVEVITLEDGERGLWHLASQNAKAWEVKGMLHHALDLETARNVVFALQGEDDD